MPKTHATLLAGDFNAECETDPSIFPDVIGNFGISTLNVELTLQFSLM